jgi:hypothetical protein
MISTSDNSSGFPPTATIASVLASSGLNPLATQAFADPNAGYAQGLRLSSAINDNSAGRFTLASGLTLAGGATLAGLDAIKTIQGTITSLQRYVGILQDPNADPVYGENARVEVGQHLRKLRDELGFAQVSDFNLLDATHSDGVVLNVQTGGLTNAGKTPAPNGSGNDQRFAFRPDRVAFQTVDVKKALDELDNLVVQTTPNTDSNLNSNGLNAIAKFQSTLTQANNALNNFKQSLQKAATEKLTVSFDGGNPSLNDSASARQIAARLATQLSNSSFNITANPALRFFSLFT